MARYDYVCDECGLFEVTRPIGSVVDAQACATCGGAASRVYASPALTAPKSALRRVQDAAGLSAHEPAVRHAVPAPVARARRPVNPMQARLPRP